MLTPSLFEPGVFPMITESGPVPGSEIPQRIPRNVESPRSEGNIYWSLDFDGTFIGYVALHGAEDSLPVISYAIRASYRRQGFAFGDVSAVRDHALSRSSVSALVARTHTTNQASAALLRRLGFSDHGEIQSPQGTRREFRFAAA